jgi:putative ABC transport system substrate-binding protein
MDRRAFVAGALGLLATPLATGAQTARKPHRIGYLGSTSNSGYHARLVEAFRRGLHDLGYVEGENLVIEYRWAEEKYDRLPDLAAELVRLPVELIVTHGTPGSWAAKRATATVPIVMAISGDAVATGLVASIARPGGNLTGSTFFFPELIAKRLELLKEAMPRADRMAALGNAGSQATAPALRALELMARGLKVDLEAVQIRGADELAGVVSAMVERRIDGVVVIDDPMLIANARRLVEIATGHRIPTIGDRAHAEAGGLMAYGVDFAEFWRHAAVFVGKILKGARPADLPIEQPTKFELVINLKTARALSLAIPPALRLRADLTIGP